MAAKRCPICNSKSSPAGPDQHKCNSRLCGVFFDNDPNEGGNPSKNDPVQAAIEAEERELAAKRPSRASQVQTLHRIAGVKPRSHHRF